MKTLGLLALIILVTALLIEPGFAMLRHGGGISGRGSGSGFLILHDNGGGFLLLHDDGGGRLMIHAD